MTLGYIGDYRGIITNYLSHYWSLSEAVNCGYQNQYNQKDVDGMWWGEWGKWEELIN